MSLPSPSQSDHDRRADRRFHISGEARLVAPFADLTCQMLNISNSGVKLVADCELSIGDVIAVDIVGIGFVRGVVSRIDESGIAAEFETDPQKQQQFEQRIRTYLETRAASIPAH